MMFPRTKGYLLGVLGTSAVLYHMTHNSDRVIPTLTSWLTLTFLFIAYLLDRIAQVPDEPIDDEPLPPTAKT